MLYTYIVVEGLKPDCKQSVRVIYFRKINCTISVSIKTQTNSTQSILLLLEDRINAKIAILISLCFFKKIKISTVEKYFLFLKPTDSDSSRIRTFWNSRQDGVFRRRRNQLGNLRANDYQRLIK